MKPIYMIAATIVALGIGAVAYRMSATPAEKPTSTLPTLVIPATVPAPTPLPAPPTEKPAPPSPAIAKIETQMRMTPVNRPMNEVAKNWFGCDSESSYNDTLTLLNQKDPAAGERFKGVNATCTALKVGWHVTVQHLNPATSVAQISVDETHSVLWTDSSALKGHEAAK